MCSRHLRYPIFLLLDIMPIRTQLDRRVRAPSQFSDFATSLESQYAVMTSSQIPKKSSIPSMLDILPDAQFPVVSPPFSNKKPEDNDNFIKNLVEVYLSFN